MDTALARLAAEALYLAVLISAPPLLAVLLVSVLMGWLQAALRIGHSDSAIRLMPKLVAALLALGLTSRWMGGELIRFTHNVLALMVHIGRA